MKQLQQTNHSDNYLIIIKRRDYIDIFEPWVVMII